MKRLEAFSAEDRWVGHVWGEAGVLSGWHHHGEHDTYFYVLSGRARIEMEGGEFIEVGQGDFAQIGAGTIHREGASGDEPLEVVLMRIGRGPQVFPVDDPDA
jgi:quercetin dioxygenase-like cupin family protein